VSVTGLGFASEGGKDSEYYF